MDTNLREIVQIIDNDRHFIMFVFTSGIREIYDITGHENIKELTEVKTTGKLIGRDYNGNSHNPPPIPSYIVKGICNECGSNQDEIEKKRILLEKKEKELIQREKELDSELEKLRN